MRDIHAENKPMDIEGGRGGWDELGAGVGIYAPSRIKQN